MSAATLLQFPGCRVGGECGEGNQPRCVRHGEEIFIHKLRGSHSDPDAGRVLFAVQPGELRSRVTNNSLKASPSVGGGTPETPGAGLSTPWPHPGPVRGSELRRRFQAGDAIWGRGGVGGEGACVLIPEVVVHVHVLIHQAVNSGFVSPLQCVCLSQ